VKIGNVHHPVTDVAAAVDFYREALGLETRFVDGQRYAGLDTDGAMLALAGPEEDITGGVAAASIKVADVGAAVRTVVRAGGSTVREPERGPHEVRAVVRDPWHNTVILYGPQST